VIALLAMLISVSVSEGAPATRASISFFALGSNSSASWSISSSTSSWLICSLGLDLFLSFFYLLTFSSFDVIEVWFAFSPDR
jgi:hypothetical protein